MPVLPSWLTNPLWDQFAALLPERPMVDPTHPLGCHLRRISDRIIFDKLLQLLRFGCSYQAIADTTCSATTIRDRRDEWIQLGVFARLGASGCCSTRSPSTAPSPKPPAAGRSRAAHLSTAANNA